jgi:hypothetical protein
MKAKLVVTFDIIDDRDNSLLRKGFWDRFETELNRSRKMIYRTDAYIVNMALLNSVSLLSSVPLENRLFPPVPGRTAPEQENGDGKGSVSEHISFSIHRKGKQK